jgi:predicted lipase
VGIILLLSGCAKNIVDKNNDLGSGDKSNLPVTLTSLIEHAEYSAAIYENGSTDEIVFEVKQNNGITIITVRGTANENNVLADLDARLVKDDVLGIYLHKGFKDASTYVMQSIDNTFVNNAKLYTLEHTVYITGHSLGGAIAQIVGMWLHKRGHNVQVYSYGSPKVSNEVLVSGQPTHFRVVRLSDPVPLSPPFPFFHTGLFIDPVTGDWGPDNDNQLISKTDGLDHAIAKYVEKLKALKLPLNVQPPTPE